MHRFNAITRNEALITTLGGEVFVANANKLWGVGNIRNGEKLFSTVTTIRARFAARAAFISTQTILSRGAPSLIFGTI